MKNRKPEPVKAKNLSAIQRAFASSIMRELTPGRRMQSKWGDGESMRKRVAGFIKPNDRLSSFERLEIYNKQYWFRLLDCIYEDFPGLRTLLGESRFHRLSVAYLAKYPSGSFTLRNLGSRLEKFLKADPKWIAPHRALAMDMARLEWAHIEAFDGDALPPLEIDELLDGDPATLRLAFQPHITFLACGYPVDDYVVAVRRREERQGEASNAVAERVVRKLAKKMARPRPGKTCIAVHRSENVVYYKRLEPEAYLICSSLQKGLSLQKSCEKAFRLRRNDAEFVETLQKWFAQWAAMGWFTRAG
jgi:hypothetical protein